MLCELFSTHLRKKTDSLDAHKQDNKKSKEYKFENGFPNFNSHLVEPEKTNRMAQVNRKLNFASSEYSLSLNLDDTGGLSGTLFLSSDYDTKRFECKGCHVALENGVINLAFTVDWTPHTESQCHFTCFSGQNVNQNIIILDWMLVREQDKKTHTIRGSCILYTSLYSDNKETTWETVKPFPTSTKTVEN